MTNGRVSRGRETERIVAEYYQAHGWPFAERTGAGRPGVDITGMPGISVEVKARRGLDATGWLRQANSRDGVAYVVFRPDGYGPARIEEWGVLMSLSGHTELLRAAGYGSEL